MTGIDARALAACAALSAGAVALDVLHYRSSLVHGTLRGACVVLAWALAWRSTRRRDASTVAGFVAAAWRVPYEALDTLLVAALALGALALIPEELARWSAFGPPAVAGAVALVVLGGGWVPLAVAIVVAASALAARPRDPTRDQLRRLHTGALLLPAFGLAVVLALNLAGGRLEGGSAAKAVSQGIGLFGVFVMLAVAGLGLATLVASSDEAQRGAWYAIAGAAGIAAASLVSRDPSVVAGALATLAVAAPFLVGLATMRLHATKGVGPWTVPIAGSAVMSAQFAFGLR